MSVNFSFFFSFFSVYADEVTTAGRIELLRFLREQSITITAHRYGTPDPWSEEVI